MLIGITTAPRPRAPGAAESCLFRTVSAVRAQSPEAVVVVAPTVIDDQENWDGLRALGCEIMDPIWDKTAMQMAETHGCGPLQAPDRHRGLERNSQRLLRHLAAESERRSGPGTVGRFITMQDDLAFCVHALDRMGSIDNWMSTSASRLVGAVSFYSPYAEVGRGSKTFWVYPRRAFYGDLCLMWRANVAQQFAAAQNLSEANDLEIQRFFTERPGLVLLAHSPCLVQHVGVLSATGKDPAAGQRTTMNFVETYDATANPKPF